MHRRKKQQIEKNIEEDLNKILGITHKQPAKSLKEGKETNRKKK